jgi:putative copper resistance protein D
MLAVLTYADVAGVPPGSPGFADQLGGFLREVDLGRAWVLVVAAATAATVAAATATRVTGSATGAALAVVALLPLAASGHASGADSHETAVSALGIHLVSVSVWAGGLAALVGLAARTSRTDLATAARRFSTLAGWGYAGVAVSGVALAFVAVRTPAGLATPYGALVLVKVAVLAALGLAGAAHRRRTLPRLDGPGGGALLVRLAVAELVLMGAAVGLGVALSRSPRPVSDEVPGGALGALGYPLPPAPTALTWVTQWRLDLLWALVAVVGVGLYVGAARRLRRRGDGWPVGRTVSWVAGMLLLGWATSGAPGVYGRVLFSSHMVGHMVISMAVPLFLVMAAPVTLALRALPARHDGSRGPREWLLELVHSRYLAVLSHPVLAGGIFAGSLVAFYWTPWFEWALRSHTGHVLMTAHFLAAGYLFAWVLAGPDPGPRRPPYLLRLVLLFAVVSFHAFFGVAVMSGSSLLAPDWFAALQRPYATDLLADQQQGGAIAWGFGELPTLVLALLVLLAWVRDDSRETRRHDRQADRDGDADLAAYNAYLARLSSADRDRG